MTTTNTASTTVDTSNTMPAASTTITMPAARLTGKERCVAYATSEERRVKHCVDSSLDGHPLGVLSDEGWQYVHDLMVHAYHAGTAQGAMDQMADINTRFTLTRR